MIGLKYSIILENDITTKLYIIPKTVYLNVRDFLVRNVCKRIY